MLAAEYVAGLGYEVIGRNVRCRRGEIDLVCRRGEEVVLVEVKTRSGDSHGVPVEAIDAHKVRALVGCVAEYRAISGWRGVISFDVVTISVGLIRDVVG